MPAPVPLNITLEVLTAAMGETLSLLRAAVTTALVLYQLVRRPQQVPARIASVKIFKTE